MAGRAATWTRGARSAQLRATPFASPTAPGPYPLKEWVTSPSKWAWRQTYGSSPGGSSWSCHQTNWSCPAECATGQSASISSAISLSLRIEPPVCSSYSVFSKKQRHQHSEPQTTALLVQRRRQSIGTAFCQRSCHYAYGMATTGGRS